MSDVWSSTLYSASYGGVEFDCLETSDSMARAIVRHSFPRREGGVLHDMGAEPRETRCRLLFWERPALEGETARGDHRARFAAFLAVVKAGKEGKAQAFVHPITGSYQAMVEDFDFDATGDERDAITADVTFVEDSTEPARFDPGSLLVVDAGAAAVRVNADLATAAFAGAGLDTAVPGDAADVVDGWESDPTTAVRKVNLELATITSQIDGLIDEFELATDVSRFPLFRSLQALNYSCRRAAALFRQRQPQLITITLAAAQPLRVVAADTYGAADAEARYADLMRLNDIDDPTLLEAGTVLQAPAPRRAA